MTTLEKIKDEILRSSKICEPQFKDAFEVCAQIIDKYAEQEPCDDAVSRQAVLEIAKQHTLTNDYLAIQDLPSVRPQEPKAGKWVDIPFSHYFKCSECDKYQISETNYCPNCGAIMVEPQESEDKE